MAGSTQKAFIRRLRLVYGVKVRTRHDWKTKHPTVYWRRRITHRAKIPADTLVEHITVTFDSGNLTGNFDADMLTLERIGMERFGSGVSYNLVIDKKTGMVGIGQDLRAKGTHTVNNKNIARFSFDQNKMARAIAWLGVPGDRISDKCYESHVKVIACLMDCGHLTVDPDYLPHSHFAFKDCPTDELRNVLPGILTEAKKLHRKMKSTKTPR